MRGSTVRSKGFISVITLEKQAQALQLTGWVRNLADGRVEVVACGPREIIMEFIDWLWQGSPSAKVSDVCWEEISQQTFTEFTIR